MFERPASGENAVLVQLDFGEGDFAERLSEFRAKGRFEDMMSRIPVKLITHPQPGLFGAAAAFAMEHPE